MKVKLIKDRDTLLDICNKFEFSLIKQEIELKYNIYDPEIGKLQPYYYVFEEDGNIMGILAVNSKGSHYKNHLQILFSEVYKQYPGKNATMKMLDWISEKAKQQGWQGISIQTLHPVHKKWLENDEYDPIPNDLKQMNDPKDKGDKVVEEYKNLGFEPVSYTSWNGINMKKTFESETAKYCDILNEIAASFDMDQWDEQVNPFIDVIDRQLNSFVHNTKYDYIYILENNDGFHDFPQFDFYKERCYVNGEKVKLSNYGWTKNKWKDQETIDVIIEDLNQLGESCNCMFCRSMSLISVPKFDTSKVTDMAGMFWGCISLESVPLFDTSNVLEMYDMFYNCRSLKMIPKFNTHKVLTMENMFGWCKSLESAPKFNTHKVTSMNDMFKWCYSLVSVPLLDTRSVTSMKDMFTDCNSLSEETKQEWSSVYNFRINEMK